MSRRIPPRWSATWPHMSARRGRGGGWTPGRLFENGELGVWYDPSDPSTLFRDTAGTVPVTADAQTVGLMRDKSGNGLDLTQAISSARPKWIAGSSHLQFDGVDDRLFRSAPSNVVSSMGLGVVTQQTGAAETDVVFGIEEAANNRFQFTAIDTGANRAIIARVGESAFPFYADGSAQTKTVSIQNWENPGVELYTDGALVRTAVLSGSISFTAAGQIYLGSSPAFSGFLFSGNFYGGIIRTPSFNADEISQLNEWLSTK